jgi:riboflavin synthase
LVFTGIVEGMGKVMEVTPEAGGVRLTVALPGAANAQDAFQIGGSVAIDGACLTVTDFGAGEVTCQVIQETLRRTTLGRLRPGARVNLERPLRVGGRLEGHWVQGHVDGRARLIERKPEGDSARFQLELLAAELGRYVVPKGSVALDGVSLTVGEATNSQFSVYLIPHTLEVTALGDRQPGDEVNVEVDILAKYLERLVGRESEIER